MATQRLPDLNLWLFVWRRVWQRLALALYRRRWNALAVAALILIGGAFLIVRAVFETPAAALGVAPIAVRVQELQPQGNTLPLVLIEKAGPRQLVIRELESTEARVIARQQGMNLQGEQPRAYDLMRDLVQHMGGRVDHVILAEGERAYIGRIVVSAGGDLRVIQAKPADAVTLALKSDAPIFVENAILDRFGVRSGP
jgi:bifunctional DNase/RNase